MWTTTCAGHSVTQCKHQRKNTGLMTAMRHLGFTTGRVPFPFFLTSSGFWQYANEDDRLADSNMPAPCTASNIASWHGCTTSSREGNWLDR